MHKRLSNGARRALLASIVCMAMAVPVVPAKSRAAGIGAPFTLTSSDIAEGKKIAVAQVFNGFGCSGKNLSPALSWSNAPAGTKSFALLVHDPDAPTGSGWWHWVVYDIPGDVSSLPSDAGDAKKNLMPADAVQGPTDFGTPGYGGPCPPPGKPHHYHFRLYALKVAKLGVPANATAAFIAFNVHANSLAETQILAIYGR
jgi:Raf kinase inhibitor-like YbhB/YbcL family protein